MAAAAEDLRRYQPCDRALAIAGGDLEVERADPGNVVLYSHYASICSQRARLVLVEKQIPFKGVMLHYDKFETLSPSYLGINPRGLVPTVVADGEVVFDSATIMRYINNRYVGPELTPGDENEVARINQEIVAADFFPIRDMVFWTAKHRGDHGATHSGWGFDMVKKYIETMESFKTQYPDFAENYELKLKDWRGQIGRINSEATMERSRNLVEETMDDFEQRLETKNYLVGENYSLADLTWTPILIRLQYSLGYKIWGDELRPNLERYFEDRIKGRGSFKAAILDHYYENVIPEGLGK